MNTVIEIFNQLTHTELADCNTFENIIVNHYNKFRKCLDNNIILVSIFETYWLNSEYSIKNYLYDLFNNIENNISYYNDYINNNYPIPNIKSIIGEHIVDCYNFDGHTIYTCGYTKIA